MVVVVGVAVGVAAGVIIVFVEAVGGIGVIVVVNDEEDCFALVNAPIWCKWALL